MEHMGLGMSWSQLTFTPWFFRGVGRKTTNQNISLMGPIKRITSRGLRWWIWFAPSMRSGSPSGGHEGPRGWKRHEKLRVSLTSWIYAMTVYPRVKIEKKWKPHEDPWFSHSENDTLKWWLVSFPHVQTYMGHGYLRATCWWWIMSAKLQFFVTGWIGHQGGYLFHSMDED